MTHLYKVEESSLSDYEKSILKGKMAQFQVYGCSRNGYLYGGRFYFTAGQKIQRVTPMAADGLAGLVVLG